MAMLDLSAISAVLNLVYADAIANIFRQDTILPRLLAVDPDGNSTCTWPVKFDARTTAGPKAEGHDVAASDFSTHTRKQASLAWGEYYSYAQVTGLVQAVSARNVSGVSPDQLLSEIFDAINELAVKISAHTYSGNVSASPTELAGLASAIDSTGAYAGLNPATSGLSAWASGENTLASAALSVDALSTKLHGPFVDATGRYPEFVVCNGTLWDRVKALFGDQTQLFVDVINTAARGEVNLRAAGGFRAIEVDGVPYLRDRHCTANTFYAIDSRNVSYRQVPASVSSVEPSAAVDAFKALTGEVIGDDEMERLLQRLAKGSDRIVPYISMLAKTGDHARAMLKVYMQLRVKARNAAAKLVLT